MEAIASCSLFSVGIYSAGNTLINSGQVNATWTNIAFPAGFDGYDVTLVNFMCSSNKDPKSSEGSDATLTINNAKTSFVASTAATPLVSSKYNKAYSTALLADNLEVNNAEVSASPYIDF